MITLGDRSKNEVGVSAETASGFIGVQNSSVRFGVEYEANISITRNDDNLELHRCDITKHTVIGGISHHDNKPVDYVLTQDDKNELDTLIRAEIEYEMECSSESIIEELDELDE